MRETLKIGEQGVCAKVPVLPFSLQDRPLCEGRWGLAVPTKLLRVTGHDVGARGAGVPHRQGGSGLTLRAPRRRRSPAGGVERAGEEWVTGEVPGSRPTPRWRLSVTSV